MGVGFAPGKYIFGLFIMPNSATFGAACCKTKNDKTSRIL